MKNLVEKLKEKPANYLEKLEDLWGILDYRKSHGQNEVQIRLYVQLGLLMQTRDEEVKEMFRILRKMIEDGGIKDGIDVDTIRTKLHPLSYWYPALKKQPAPVQETGDEANVTPRRDTVRGPRYVPQAGDWQCAICKFWNKNTERHCMRKRSKGLIRCKGSKGSTCAKVQD